MRDAAASASPAEDPKALKLEGAGDDVAMAEPKPTYKSWKKKYRKMHIEFAKKAKECEELHAQEQKAYKIIQRIAIENDRVLDMLLDVNRSAQIPWSKRTDLSLPSDGILEIDEIASEERQSYTKSLEKLLVDVPHLSYQDAKEHNPSLVEDLEPFEGADHPPSQLTADDIDNYLYELDKRLDNKILPTMAPLAKDSSATSQHIVKNPTSEWMWLRKHAPGIFLQDGSSTTTAAAVEDADDASSTRKGKSGKAERPTTKPSSRSKRVSTKNSADADSSIMEDDTELASTPATSRGGKRKRDDDPGYRPRGSTSRPSKKKRKSDGVEVSTPTAPSRKSKKESNGNVEKGAKDE